VLAACAFKSYLRSHHADFNIGPSPHPEGATDGDAEENAEEPPALSPPPADPTNVSSFEYDPADPAFLKDSHLGLRDMKDEDAYSILLGLARASQKEKRWKTHLIAASKHSSEILNTKAFTNNKSTRAQDHAHRGITKWVSSISCIRQPKSPSTEIFA
jgi:hypothetical protein